MDSQTKKPNLEIPAINVSPTSKVLSIRISRRQILKASLFGAGALVAAAGGLAGLESLAAAPASLGRWRRLVPNTAPSPRSQAAIAYDGARRAPVLFSGTTGDADTWTWNGITWTRQSPPLSPPARSGASFAYHLPTQTLVLFGGMNAKGFLGDTWLWNGRTWIAVQGAGPPARIAASMAFDPVTSSLILFGGYGDGTLDDTWKWEGTAWRRLSPTSSPPPLAGASLAFSAAVGKLILFGGERHATGAGGPATTWTWDGINWSELAFASSPSGRAFAAMAADPAGRLILLFGGLANGSLLGDTWTLTSVWSADTRSAAPPPRAYSSLVADPSSNSLLLFGGESASGRMGDTWAWSTF